VAAAASLSLGEVRRYRKILALPKSLRRELLGELEKPRGEQKLTVDHVIEAMDGASRLAKAEVVPKTDTTALVKVIVDKFRSQVLTSTVEPRKLSRIARAVERNEISADKVRKEIARFTSSPKTTINQVFERTVEHADFSHGTEQLVSRSLTRLREIRSRNIEVSAEFRKTLEDFVAEAKAILGS
jgi:hypothetical protein